MKSPIQALPDGRGSEGVAGLEVVAEPRPLGSGPQAVTGLEGVTEPRPLGSGPVCFKTGTKYAVSEMRRRVLPRMGTLRARVRTPSLQPIVAVSPERPVGDRAADRQADH